MSRFLTEVLLSMNKKNIKFLLIAGIAVDTILTIGLFVLSIVLLVHFNTTTQAELLTEEGFIGWFVKEPNRIIYTVMKKSWEIQKYNILIIICGIDDADEIHESNIEKIKMHKKTK